MKRVVSPDKALREVDGIGGGIRYRQRPDGTFHVTDRDAKALIQYGGFIQPDMGVGKRAEGYRCTGCGFGSWFRKCSRCGGECDKEA